MFVSIIKRGKHTVYKHGITSQMEVTELSLWKKGGGTRKMEYKADEDLTLETIIKRGTQYFLPQGKSAGWLERYGGVSC